LRPSSDPFYTFSLEPSFSSPGSRDGPLTHPSQNATAAFGLAELSPVVYVFLRSGASLFFDLARQVIPWSVNPTAAKKAVITFSFRFISRHTATCFFTSPFELALFFLGITLWHSFSLTSPLLSPVDDSNIFFFPFPCGALSVESPLSTVGKRFTRLLLQSF